MIKIHILDPNDLTDIGRLPNTTKEIIGEELLIRCGYVSLEEAIKQSKSFWKEYSEVWSDVGVLHVFMRKSINSTEYGCIKL